MTKTLQERLHIQNVTPSLAESTETYAKILGLSEERTESAKLLAQKIKRHDICKNWHPVDIIAVAMVMINVINYEGLLPSM